MSRTPKWFVIVVTHIVLYYTHCEAAAAPNLSLTTSAPNYDYYLVKDNPLSFQDAQTFCNNICNSDLASIPSDTQWTAFSDALDVERQSLFNNDISVWIGLTDSENEGTFKYIDNTLYDINNFNKDPWKTNEPDNGDGGTEEDCVTVIVGATSNVDKWRDTICSNPKWFVCNYCITNGPTSNPTVSPITINPSISPTNNPITSQPTIAPTGISIPAPSTTANPTTTEPTTAEPTTAEPTTYTPTTSKPTANPSTNPSTNPTTLTPTNNPSTSEPTNNPSTTPTTYKPTVNPSQNPITVTPTNNPITTTSVIPVTSSTDSTTTIATTSILVTSTTDTITTASTSSTSISVTSTADSTTTEQATTTKPIDTTTTDKPTGVPTLNPITSKPTVNPTTRGTTKQDESGQAHDDETTSTKIMDSDNNGNSDTSQVVNGLNIDEIINYVLFGLSVVVICLSIILMIYCIKQKRKKKKKDVKERNAKRNDSNESGTEHSTPHKLQAIASNSFASLYSIPSKYRDGAATTTTTTRRQITGTGTNTASTGSVHIELEMEGGLSNKHGITLRRDATNLEAEGDHIRTRGGYGSIASADSIGTGGTGSIPINPIIPKLSADSVMNDDANSDDDDDDDANSNAESDDDGNVTKGGDVLPQRINMIPMGPPPPRPPVMVNNYYSDISMAPSMSQQAMPHNLSTKGGDFGAMRKGTDSFNNYAPSQPMQLQYGGNSNNYVIHQHQGGIKKSNNNGYNGGQGVNIENAMDIAPPCDDANSDNDENQDEEDANSNAGSDHNNGVTKGGNNNNEHNGLLPGSYTTGGDV